ncbi:HAMP domain-containing histidine kinase [Lysinibacillus agricola]|uniref:histidine kinase n=1 Tax=Lysinibacillus agricola TaxID=2590012 RepID=A0ABX7AYT3_9BACI|nr:MULTISPECIES: HAMP domain-containing sensor histidine kinase [Lysinibacillus]KOS60131.1 histidine kinase [Lysinibacillus sp. FJAT-14222]QQP14417.1 HAMP domain-containing histidine kinase [Lysinibacillus agricola]
MKIKTWLLITFFIVMILPIAGAYSLYVWINAYYQDKNGVAEYFEKLTELNQVKSVLENPMYYTKNADIKDIEALTNDHLAITLYSKSGLFLYSSNPLKSVSGIDSKDSIFKGLYELKQNYNAFTYKEPVYQDGELLGVYEIQLVRTDWVKGVESRSWLVIASSILLFLLIYFAVMMLLNRRLNRPLHELMRQMRAFAKGEHVESNLVARKDEIGELAQTFLAMQDEIEIARTHLKAEQQQKELMIASISHDLKTPLTAIQAYAESLQSKTLSEEQQDEYRQIILTKSETMKHMLEDLLMYTLLQSTSYHLELVAVDGAEYFEMALSDYEQLCKDQGFMLEVTCDIEGMYAVHPKQLQRVIDNLMSNAWRYGAVDTAIGLAAVNAGKSPIWCFDFVKPALTMQEGMYLIVQNCGQGVNKEGIEKLFEPLYQADTARTKAGERGTGLGLNIAKQIIEKHGGTVELVSKEGYGTAVLCWLPPYEGEI